MNVSPLVYDLVQSHNVRMVQVGQRRDLAMNGLFGILIRKVLFFICFQSDYSLGLFMSDTTNYREGPLPNLEAYLEVFELQGLRIGVSFFGRVYSLDELLQAILFSDVEFLLILECSHWSRVMKRR